MVPKKCDLHSWSSWEQCKLSRNLIVIVVYLLTVVVCILLGISPASDFSLPTFRNPLSVPSSRAGCRVLYIQQTTIGRRGNTQKNTYNKFYLYKNNKIFEKYFCMHKQLRFFFIILFLSMLQFRFSLRKETLKPQRSLHTTLNTHLSLVVHLPSRISLSLQLPSTSQ